VSEVVIREVGPRDGLQNEPTILPTEVRAELVRRLLATGLREVEAVSFVRADRVPAMAEPEAVVARVDATNGAVLSGLVLNERGYDRALSAGLTDLHYGFPVTDTFAQRNQNSTTERGLALARRLVERSREDRVTLDVGLICAFGCPFEGRLPVAVHLHNTRNTGIANAYAAVEAGATLLDASVGGAGGCPFAPNATGNIATEDLVYLLRGIGIDTGVSLDELIEVAHWLEHRLGKTLPSMLARAGDFSPVR
jgi:(R)-citramalyl-CoA lyase